MLQRTILGRLQNVVELDRLTKKHLKQGIDVADPAILRLKQEDQTLYKLYA